MVGWAVLGRCTFDLDRRHRFDYHGHQSSGTNKMRGQMSTRDAKQKGTVRVPEPVGEVVDLRVLQKKLKKRIDALLIERDVKYHNNDAMWNSTSSKIQHLLHYADQIKHIVMYQQTILKPAKPEQYPALRLVSNR